VAPWTTVDEVLAQMEFRPLVADKLEVLQPPTEDELKMIRSGIDPSRLQHRKGRLGDHRRHHRQKIA
jgi:glutaconate CoA-transferase subunit B